MHKALSLTTKGFLTPHKYHGPRELPRDPKGFEDFLVEELGFLFIREERVESMEENNFDRGYHREVVIHRVFKKNLKRSNRKGEYYEAKIRTLFTEEGGGRLSFQQVIIKRSWEPLKTYTLCPRSTGWAKYGKGLWERGYWGAPLLRMFNFMPIHLEDLKPDPIELKYEFGSGLVLTQGSLTQEWVKAHILHYLEDGGTLYEQVMARESESEIQIQRLFDILKS